MKAKSLIILLLLLAAASCSRHSRVSDILAHAEAVMEEHPDSALSILQAVPDSALVTDRDRALHALLLSQALDKNYIDITSDSLINIALDYFRDHNDPAHLALTYYYQGRIYVELGDAPSALEHFQKALDVLKEHPDKDLENRIYAQRAHILYLSGMIQKGIEEDKKALDICFELNDTVGIVEIANSLGYKHYTLNNLDSAMVYFQLGLDFAERLEVKGFQNALLSSIMIIHIDRNELQQAEQIYRRCSSDWAFEIEKSTFHSNGAKLAIAQNDIILLKQHLDWLVDSGNVYGKRFALRKLLVHFNNIYTPDSISRLASELFTFEDSIQIIKDSHEVVQFEHFYNYNLHSKENQRLKIEKERLKFNIAIAVMMIIILLGAVYFIWYKFNIKIKHQKMVFENLRKEYYKVYGKIRERKNNEILGRVNLISNPEINEIVNSALHEESIKNLNWTRLEEMMKQLDSNFCSKIGGDYVLSNIEWKVTMLIRIGLSPQQIGQIIHMSPSGITSIRKRLYKKVFGVEPNSPKDWDAVVFSL